MNWDEGMVREAEGAGTALRRIARLARAWFARAAHLVPAAQTGAGSPESAAGAGIVCWRSILPRQPRVLAVGSRQTIVCESGTVWITQGDGQDYVLTPGRELTLKPRDTVVVTAMDAPARIHCRAPSDAASSPAGQRHPAGRRRGQLARRGAAGRHAMPAQLECIC